jgi:hypothetical protein
MMRRTIFIIFLMSLPIALLADDASDDNDAKQVHAGATYGGAIFAGLFTGALVGAAAGAWPYASDRKNQDPEPVIMDTIYGAVAGAVGLSTPCAAYEVASDKPGAAKRIIFNTFGFAVMGGVIGALGGSISYRNKVGVDDSSAEDFLGAAAGGVMVGALVGLGVGIADGVFYEGPGKRVPGKGIHAELGIVQLASVRVTPMETYALPNVTLARLEF